MRWLLFASLMLIGPVQAGEFFWHADKFRSAPIVTEEQVRQACSADARRLCWRVFPNREAIVECMTEKRSQIGPGCATMLKATGK